MTSAEIIGVIFGGLTILGSLLWVWIQTQLKIKAIEKDIVTINIALEELKEDQNDIYKLIEKNNDKVYDKLEKIEGKLDKQFEEITILKSRNV